MPFQWNTVSYILYFMCHPLHFTPYKLLSVDTEIRSRQNMGLILLGNFI